VARLPADVYYREGRVSEPPAVGRSVGFVEKVDELLKIDLVLGLGARYLDHCIDFLFCYVLVQ